MRAVRRCMTPREGVRRDRRKIQEKRKTTRYRLLNEHRGVRTPLFSPMSSRWRLVTWRVPAFASAEGSPVGPCSFRRYWAKVVLQQHDAN